MEASGRNVVHFVASELFPRVVEKEQFYLKKTFCGYKRGASSALVSRPVPSFACASSVWTWSTWGLPTGVETFPLRSVWNIDRSNQSVWGSPLKITYEEVLQSQFCGDI